MCSREITKIGSGAGYFDETPEKTSFQLLDPTDDLFLDQLDSSALYAYLAPQLLIEVYKDICS
jgi:hypothetical protein